MKTFRVITEGRDEFGHHCARGDIVALRETAYEYEDGLADYVVMSGSRVGLQQVLSPTDVEAIV